MGTRVYGNLLSLLLDEGDFTIDELIQIGKERYDFDPGEMRFNFQLFIDMHGEAIQLTNKGKYHKTKDFVDAYLLLGFIPQAPKEYFEAHPKWKNFYEDLTKRRSASKSKK